MPREVVGSMSEWSGVLKDLFRQIDDGSHTLDAVKAFNEHRNLFEEVANQQKEIVGQEKKVEIQERAGVPNIALAKAYDLLGMKAEYEEACKTFDLTEDPRLWKLVMVKGLTFSKIVQTYQAAGIKLDIYRVNLEGVIAKDQEQRDPNRDGSYVVSFHRRVEADEENKDQRASDRRRQGCQDDTLIECLLLGLAYFLATGKHLDTENVTQCSGSRYVDGDVPRVYWRADDRRVIVGWYAPDDRNDSLRARSVVSRQPEPVRA